MSRSYGRKPGSRYGVTPSDFLFDRERILGGPGTSVSLKPSGKTVLHQPRVEAEAVRQTQLICPSDAIPVTKPPNFLSPSRQAETFYVQNCVEVTGGTWDEIYGITPATTNVLSIETFEGMKTVVKRIQVDVHDALQPSYLGTQITINGQPLKLIAQPGDGAAITPSTPPTSPGYVNIVDMPEGIQNVTREVVDRKRVDVSVSNSAPVPRVVCVSLWGWVEPITSLDDRIKV